jgi:hypothetical protein|tara:strand:+ start:47 stop:670 length:624 start_codon:yes stop_codon:yes gene_type:complete
MGFDLYGENPSGDEVPQCNFQDEDETKAYFAWQNNTDGAYFRNNVWYWRPLWDYVSDVCSDILSEKDIESGSYNDGHLIIKAKSIKIARRLFHLEKSGDIEKYERRYTDKMKSLPKEECNICKGTGTRKGWEGWQSEEKWLRYHPELEPENPELGKCGFKWANEMKGCNACHGEGKKDAFISSYPFSAENVVKFAKFCNLSGGFRIS